MHPTHYQLGNRRDAPWMTNLEGGVADLDENEELRREATLHLEGHGRADPPKEKEAEPRENKKSKKTKEEGKKVRKKEKGPKKEKKKKREEEVEATSSSNDLEPGQRPLEDIFYGTGLDPVVRRRRRMIKKAKKVGRTKKKKDKKKGSKSSDSQSSGSTSSGSSSLEAEGSSLFASERRLKRIWQKYPGCLAASTIGEAKNALVTAAGTV